MRGRSEQYREKDFAVLLESWPAAFVVWPLDRSRGVGPAMAPLVFFAGVVALRFALESETAAAVFQYQGPAAVRAAGLG